MKRQTAAKIRSDDQEIGSHYSTHTRKFLDPKWVPSTRQDVVDLLLECQIGYISCGKATDILISKGILNVGI
jgi:hypothetical protein